MLLGFAVRGYSRDDALIRLMFVTMFVNHHSFASAHVGGPPPGTRTSHLDRISRMLHIQRRSARGWLPSSPPHHYTISSFQQWLFSSTSRSLQQAWRFSL